jgi:hypothetical protein
MSNKRIVAQSGAFLLFGLDDREIYSDNLKLLGEEYSEIRGIKTRQIYFSYDDKLKIKNDLEKLGIHAGTLFPDLGNAAEYLTQRYSRFDDV